MISVYLQMTPSDSSLSQQRAQHLRALVQAVADSSLAVSEEAAGALTAVGRPMPGGPPGRS